MKELPVVVWLVHGVHGNEISSSDAALLEAYHLLAAQGDADVDLVLRDALVLIDPMQNPDGRARFVFQNLQGRAATPDPDALQRRARRAVAGRPLESLPVRHEPRLVRADAARDRAAASRWPRDYWPQVNVDLHEQGGDNTYYFAPPADPLNPHITKSQIAAFDLFGRANGQRVRRARLAVLHPRGLRLVLSGLRRLVADLPGLDRHDLRAGLGARPVVRAARRHRAHLSRRRHAPLQRRDRHRDHRGEEPRAAGARLPRVPQAARWPKARRARSASTCWCPGTIRRARTCWREPGHAGHRGAARRRAGDRRRTATAGRHLPRVARAAVGTADPEPAGAAHPAARRLHQAAGGAARPAAAGPDLRHHRVEPAADVRRGGADQPDGDRRTVSDAADVLRRTAGGEGVCRGQGRLPDALGLGRRGAHRGGAGAGHPHAQRRRRVHAQWPPLSDRHGGDPQRRQRRRSACPADRARHEARRRGRAHRHDLRRVRHLDRQQRGPRPEGAARAAGLGYADADPVGRMDPLHARAALRPGRDRGSRVVARACESLPRSTSSCCRRATTRARSTRR